MLAEIFPSNIRGKAMGIATMVNRGTSFVVAYTFLTMCERLEWSGTFYLYAAFAGERAARRGVGIIVARPRARAAQRAPAAGLVRTLRATLRSLPPLPSGSCVLRVLRPLRARDGGRAARGDRATLR